MTNHLHTELLILTMEEAGELVQACSKVWRKDADTKSLQLLLEEAGDVYCMIELLVEHGMLSWSDIAARSNYKKQKLSTWSQLVTKTDTK